MSQSPGGEDEEPHSSGRGNIAAIIAVVVLLRLATWLSITSTISAKCRTASIQGAATDHCAPGNSGR